MSRFASVSSEVVGLLRSPVGLPQPPGDDVRVGRREFKGKQMTDLVDDVRLPPRPPGVAFYGGAVDERVVIGPTAARWAS